MRFNSKGALALVLNRVVRIGPFHFFYADRKERLQIDLANKPHNRLLLTAEERRLLRGPRKRRQEAKI